MTSKRESTSASASIAFIGLGSNLDDRENFLLQAIKLLHHHPFVDVIRCSHLYETAPVGYLEQPSFLNMAAALTTKLSVEQLFARMVEIEERLGRTREVRWGPRTIDLDLLLFDQKVISRPDLTIPHPRMLERAFVVIPLTDVLGNERVPGVESISAALEKLDGKDDVTLWKIINWHRESGLFAN